MMTLRKTLYPAKRSMNLYYKPDRRAKTAVLALYTLILLAGLLGLGRLLVYDVLQETAAAQEALAVAEEELNGVLLELADCGEIEGQYQRRTETDEEKNLVDRMEILALLDQAVGVTADMEMISVTGDTVRIQFSGVTLAQTARIVNALESSPIVAGTTVNTAATTQDAAARAGLPVQVNVLIHLQKEAVK